MKHILFLCIGNSCRSQMAEAFAKAYGKDILFASSAGLSPAPSIAPYTRQVMAERNISLENHFPKPLNLVDLSQVDVIVNMSGMPMVRDPGVPVENWRVEDPVGQSIDKFRQVATEIERGVLQIIVGLRQAEVQTGGAGARSSHQQQQQPQQQQQQPAANKPLPPKFGRPRIPRG